MANILRELDENHDVAQDLVKISPEQTLDTALNLAFDPKKTSQKWQDGNRSLLLKESLTTFYAANSHQFFSQVNTENWGKGICPLCGQKPFISRLDKRDGSRYIKCHLCYLEWRFPRLSCPFCKCKETGNVSYYFADNDKAHRIEVCESCRHYLKTVDERITWTAHCSPICSQNSVLARRKCFGAN